jgi:hypothetical protein
VSADDAINTISRWDVPKGTQVLVNFHGSDAMLCIVNPDDGRKPYFLFNDSGFEEITGLVKEGEGCNPNDLIQEE